MTAAGALSCSPAKDKTTSRTRSLTLAASVVGYHAATKKQEKKQGKPSSQRRQERSTGRQYHYWPFGGQSLGAVIETFGVGSSISSGNVASSSMTFGASAARKRMGGSHSDVSGRLVRRSGGERCRKTAGPAERTLGGVGFRAKLSPLDARVRRKNTSGRRCKRTRTTILDYMETSANASACASRETLRSSSSAAGASTRHGRRRSRCFRCGLSIWRRTIF
ncbi:hypothetical protein MTO96_004008 [Rhipicephalus appendiculatus]